MPRESLVCPSCGSISRNRHVAKVILETFAPRCSSLVESAGVMQALDIYEVSCQGPLHDTLECLPHYRCSEYREWDAAAPVEEVVRHEDLRRLTFADNCFDLVVSEDVLEHVDGYESAFREIRRVLKPGGYHVFTVPYFGPFFSTRIRATSSGGTKVYILPPVYHDSLTAKVLVYSDFGRDLPGLLRHAGLEAELVGGSWRLARRHGIAQSVVFRARKAVD